VWLLSARGCVLLGAPNVDSYSRSSISSSLVAERISRLEGDESASYAAPDDATADIFSTI
jgi:hypothetical protein